jgi:hypothetical protein
MSRLVARAIVVAGLAASTSWLGAPALAQSTPASPTFGSRTEHDDGSVALSVGRELQSEWNTRIGIDAHIVPEQGPEGIAETVLQGGEQGPSTGTVWGRIEAPAPLFWDKTSVDVRLDPLQDQGQISATMSRTVPLGDTVSVTLQDKYSATQSLQGTPPAVAAIPPGASVWETDRSVRFNLKHTGTTLSAGVATVSGDPQWHNRISAEQRIGGPLSITTTVTDPSGPDSNKSISARFRHTW